MYPTHAVGRHIRAQILACDLEPNATGQLLVSKYDGMVYSRTNYDRILRQNAQGELDVFEPSEEAFVPFEELSYDEQAEQYRRFDFEDLAPGVVGEIKALRDGCDESLAHIFRSRRAVRLAQDAHRPIRPSNIRQARAQPGKGPEPKSVRFDDDGQAGPSRPPPPPPDAPEVRRVCLELAELSISKKAATKAKGKSPELAEAHSCR